MAGRGGSLPASSPVRIPAGKAPELRRAAVLADCSSGRIVATRKLGRKALQVFTPVKSASNQLDGDTHLTEAAPADFRPNHIQSDVDLWVNRLCPVPSLVTIAIGGLDKQYCATS